MTDDHFRLVQSYLKDCAATPPHLWRAPTPDERDAISVLLQHAMRSHSRAPRVLEIVDMSGCA